MQDQGDLPLIDTEDKVDRECSECRLLHNYFQITLCLSNLMLTGSATPYLHNGIISADDDDATNFEVGQQFGCIHLKYQ